MYKTFNQTVGEKRVKRIVVVFTSGSAYFLEALSSVLRSKLNLRQGKVYVSRRSFQVRYSTEDTVKVFKFLYKECKEGGCLERKFRIFSNFFQLCPHRADAEISRIFKNYHMSGAVAK